MKWGNFIGLFLLVAILGCEPTEKAPKQLIAISWYYPESDYQNWINSVDTSFKFIELYSLADADIDSVLAASDGLILTGGPDIDPRHFNGIDTNALCGAPNPRRDSIELLTVAHALSSHTPILAVCRGMQMINVGMGGSLVLDLPTERATRIHQEEDRDAIHYVYSTSEYFQQMYGVDSGSTNSNHHQAILELGPNLVIDGIAKDSIIEAVHHKDIGAYPFFVGVQWHPERMDGASPMSSSLAKSFVQSIHELSNDH